MSGSTVRRDPAAETAPRSTTAIVGRAESQAPYPAPPAPVAPIPMFSPYVVTLAAAERTTIEADSEPAYWLVMLPDRTDDARVDAWPGDSVPDDYAIRVYARDIARLPGRQRRLSLRNRGTGTVVVAVYAVRGLEFDPGEAAPSAGSGAPTAGTQVFDGSVTFPNSAAANSVQAVTFDVPIAEAGARYLVEAFNPSTVTALTVRLQNRETLGGTPRNIQVTTLAVPVNSGRAVTLDGWPQGDNQARIEVSNDTVLGAADTFTAWIRVRRV